MKSLKQFLCESQVLFGIDMDNLMKLLHDNYDGDFAYEYDGNEPVVDVTKDGSFLFSIEKNGNETHFCCPSGIRDLIIEEWFGNQSETKIQRIHSIFFDIRGF